MKKIEVDAKCPRCKGTGLYKGVAERDGFAVVCFHCKGAGHLVLKLEWEDFGGRVPMKNVETVLECNPGIVVASDRKLAPFGGMPYDDWADGKPFPARSEMRNYTCPAWWSQCAPGNTFEKWPECWDSIGRSFSECKFFGHKAACWARYDREKERVSA